MQGETVHKNLLILLCALVQWLIFIMSWRLYIKRKEKWSWEGSEQFGYVYFYKYNKHWSSHTRTWSTGKAKRGYHNTWSTWCRRMCTDGKIKEGKVCTCSANAQSLTVNKKINTNTGIASRLRQTHATQPMWAQNSHTLRYNYNTRALTTIN